MREGVMSLLCSAFQSSMFTLNHTYSELTHVLSRFRRTALSIHLFFFSLSPRRFLKPTHGSCVPSCTAAPRRGTFRHRDIRRLVE